MKDKCFPHYSFDDILEYIKNFDDQTVGNFLHRKPSKILENKTEYGSNEIVLTDLIFSGIKTIYTKPISFDNLLNPLLFFYILYETYKDNKEFMNILQSSLEEAKEKVKEELKENNYNNLDRWNFNDMNEFLFGNFTKSNKFCCVFPLYETIPDKYRTKIFYMSYLNAIFDMVNNEDACEMNYSLNYRYEYFIRIAKYMKKFDNKLNENEISSDVFNHTFSTDHTHSQEVFYFCEDDKYLFNKYYNNITCYSMPDICKNFINEFIEKFCTQFRSPISNDINKIFEIFEKFKNKDKYGKFSDVLTKKYDECIMKNILDLVEGDIHQNQIGGIHPNQEIKLSCEDGQKGLDFIKVNNINPKYKIYELKFNK
jgi:hypothetical protein